MADFHSGALTRSACKAQEPVLAAQVVLTNVLLVSLLFLFSTEEDERIALGINAGLGSFRWSWRFRSCQQVTS